MFENLLILGISVTFVTAVLLYYAQPCLPTMPCVHCLQTWHQEGSVSICFNVGHVPFYLYDRHSVVFNRLNGCFSLLRYFCIFICNYKWTDHYSTCYSWQCANLNCSLYLIANSFSDDTNDLRPMFSSIMTNFCTVMSKFWSNKVFLSVFQLKVKNI